MDRYQAVAIGAASVLTVGIAMMGHELGHVFAGLAGGGSPGLLTATELKGDFESLSPAGLVALGISGSLVNVVFCLLGAWVLGRGPASSGARLTAWFFFAVNGMLVATKMVSEAAVGFGDWMTVLKPLPSELLLRGVVVAVGLVGLIFMIRRSGATLARILPSGPAPDRAREARRIVLIGALASGILVVGGSVSNPIGIARGTLLALGAGLGPFVPMLFAVRHVARAPSAVSTPLGGAGWPWTTAACLATAVFWFVVGPGIDLSNLRG